MGNVNGVIHITPVTYFLNNTFLMHFTSFLMYSYDVFCKVRDLFPDWSHEFLLNDS